MPIIFVHGVRNRPGAEWEKQSAARKTFFQRYALRGLVTDPLQTFYDEPMWGRYGAAPRWNNASLPSGDFESFDVTDNERADALAIVEAGLRPVRGVATHRQLLERTRRVAAEGRQREERQALEELLDALASIAAAGEQDEIALDALVDFSLRAEDYARHNPAPDWLDEVSDDVELLNAFADKVAEWPLQHDEPTASPAETEAFKLEGFRDRLIEAVERASGISGRLAGRAFTAAVRTSAHETASIFLGDVVVYLNERGRRGSEGKIVTVVGDAIANAKSKVTAVDSKLVVVAHSMGGNIVYDLLTHFRPDLSVDVFVTVGSQVAFFEELGQFRSSPTEPPADPENERIPRPNNVGRWINVFDLNDMFGFAAEGVYRGVEDFKYSTGEGALKAHGAYFTLPSFHDRLREHLARW